MILAGTGHRPPRLGLGYDLDSRKRLYDFTKRALQSLPARPSAVISGGAAGFDQALAAAAVVLRIPLWVYLPFRGQEQNWPADARERYKIMLGKAAKLLYVSEGPYRGRRDNVLFTKRDERMVNDCDQVLALWDGGGSGTGLTVGYAQRIGRPVLNVWEQWRR